jgi:hypothetical protein
MTFSRREGENVGEQNLAQSEKQAREVPEEKVSLIITGLLLELRQQVNVERPKHYLLTILLLHSDSKEISASHMKIKSSCFLFPKPTLGSSDRGPGPSGPNLRYYFPNMSHGIRK